MVFVGCMHSNCQWLEQQGLKLFQVSENKIKHITQNSCHITSSA